jgi:hypothetical protein
MVWDTVSVVTVPPSFLVMFLLVFTIMLSSSLNTDKLVTGLAGLMFCLPSPQDAYEANSAGGCWVLTRTLPTRRRLRLLGSARAKNTTTPPPYICWITRGTTKPSKQIAHAHADLSPHSLLQICPSSWFTGKLSPPPKSCGTNRITRVSCHMWRVTRLMKLVSVRVMMFLILKHTCILD